LSETITLDTGVVRRSLVVPFDSIEWRDSGNPDTPTDTTIRGHAAVYNSLSGDLGGFRELIEPGAFRAALRAQPDVRLLLNHDSNFVMARTASGTLELREDTTGLHVFARVDRRISWVEDLRTSMQRGDIDQMSFAFTLKDNGDDWAVAENGDVVRTIRADGVDSLFDVSVVTYPAYEATAVNIRSDIDRAIRSGRLPDDVVARLNVGNPDIAPTVGVEESESRAAGSAARRALVLAKARRAAATTPTPR
jgi:HK97 family phage prohead protease